MRRRRNRLGRKKKILKKLAGLGLRINFKVLRGFLIIVLVLVGLAQIALANSLSAEGEQIRLLEEEKSELLGRNDDLREKIAGLGSLERIKEAAEKRLGMKSGEEVMEFLVPPKLASR